MSKWISNISRKVPKECVVDRCAKDGCSVATEGLPSKQIIIDLDCYDTVSSLGKKRCDYLIAAEDRGTLWILPVELKSGGFQASSIIKQLQAGADQAKQLVHYDNSIILMPVLAHRRKRRMHRNDTKLLREKEIVLFGKRRRVILVECGANLRRNL